MSVSPKFRKRVLVEIDLLTLLLDRYVPLIEKSKSEPPVSYELDALAAFLHSFYTGIEHTLKQIAKEFGETNLMRREEWHTALLRGLSQACAARPAVVSEDLCGELKGYLDFRHVFRHAYTFQLQWTKMNALVLGASDTFRRFEKEISSFLDSVAPEE